jgi:hypothetical protein
MTNNTSEYGRLAIISAFASIAAFTYFSGLGALLEIGQFETPTVVARAIAAVVVGTMLALRSRVEGGTIIDAARAGCILAVIVVISNGLLGSEQLGKAFAIRSAGTLLGLPLLAVLTHVLGQTRLGQQSG